MENFRIFAYLLALFSKRTLKCKTLRTKTDDEGCKVMTVPSMTLWVSRPNNEVFF